MKSFIFRILFLIVLCSTSVSYAQEFNAGIFSGINFSDIHGQDIGGKWKSKPGPVQGFYLGYSFNKSFGISTGINFSTIYYEHRSTSYPRSSFPGEYNISRVPFYYQESDKMDFRFLRVPILFKVTVPSTLEFNIRAGIFFSFLQGKSLTNYYYYYNDKDISAKHDFGYIFSSGISYPLNNSLRVNLDVAYLTGRKKFLENLNFRHGSSEFTLGLHYSLPLKNNYGLINPGNVADSTSGKLTVRVTIGTGFSWNSVKGPGKNYSPLFAPEFGFLFDFPTGTKSSFQTGFSFQRKGYALSDSSSSFFQYTGDTRKTYSVNSKVQIDYAIIPALVNLRAGKADRISIFTGPWLGLKLNARNVGVALDETTSATGYLLRKTAIYDDFEKSVRDYDLGWLFGCGVSVPVIKSYKVEIAMQYSIGFRDVYYNTGTGYQENPYDPVFAIRNRTVSLHLRFILP